MPHPTVQKAEVRSLLGQLAGRPATKVRLGHGSFVTLTFDDPGQPAHADARRDDHSGWYLWIYLAAWRLDNEDGPVIGCEDSRERIGPAVQVLDGHVVESVELGEATLELTLAFQGGHVLRVFPIYSEGYKHWMLFTPDGMVLTAGPGNSCRSGPSSMADE